MSQKTTGATLLSQKCMARLFFLKKIVKLCNHIKSQMTGELIKKTWYRKPMDVFSPRKKNVVMSFALKLM